MTEEAEARAVEAKMGAILEQLAARFDLVLEAPSKAKAKLGDRRKQVLRSARRPTRSIVSRTYS